MINSLRNTFPRGQAYACSLIVLGLSLSLGQILAFKARPFQERFWWSFWVPMSFALAMVAHHSVKKKGRDAPGVSAPDGAAHDFEKKYARALRRAAIAPGRQHTGPSPRRFLIAQSSSTSVEKTPGRPFRRPLTIDADAPRQRSKGRLFRPGRSPVGPKSSAQTSVETARNVFYTFRACETAGRPSRNPNPGKGAP